MRHALTSLAVALTLWSKPLHAQTAPATPPAALPDGVPYPGPSCTKPQMNLVKPEAGNSQAVNMYNAKVYTFNKQAAAYDSCLHAYIDTANRDVKAIQDKANADLKEISEHANAAMKEIEDKIGQAVADGKSVSAALNEETAKLGNGKESGQRHN